MSAAPLLAPLLASLIALACAAVVGLDARRRPAPDKVAWLIAFALFAVAAGAEVVGGSVGWSAPLARLYYLSGAVLVVGYLALGELFLVAPRRTARVGPGLMLLVTAVAATLVLDAPIDAGRLATDGWQALERGPGLVAIAVVVNGGGSAVLVGGLLVSAWRFWRRDASRHRMIGCLLIAVGTLTVASGGTLARSGRPEYLYLAMSVGIGLIFAGYLEARRRDVPAMEAPAMPTSVLRQQTAPMDDPSSPAAGRTVSPTPLEAPASRPAEDRARTPAAPIDDEPHSGAPAPDPAIAFIETCFLPLPPDAVARLCNEWGIEAREVERFDREGARRVWALRLRLAPALHGAFDRLPVPTRWQLAELYDEVLAPNATDDRPPPRLATVSNRREGTG